MTLHIVQVRHPRQGRKVAVVEEDRLHLLLRFPSVYYAALAADAFGKSLAETLLSDRSGETLAYKPIYHGESSWRLLPPFDHPEDPARCLVTGTGLTHRKSAENRSAMHQNPRKENAQPPSPDAPAPLTDSLKMYQLGETGGKPEPGTVGAQPEWFYKGDGTILRAHGEPLLVPNFGDDGGEEPELVGVYFIDSSGSPRRIGHCIGNEFSDHVMEKQNYLYLAPSKLRTCAIGPELILGEIEATIPGEVSIQRGNTVLWHQEIATGFGEMVHSRENLEHHHFKYPSHRRAGDVHLHFFGTGAFSFGAGILLEDGDLMQISLDGFGKPLVNSLRIETAPLHPTLVSEI